MSNVGGVNIPDPGFYSSGTLPWGLDPATSPIKDTTAPVPANAKQIQAEYKTLQQQDTAELLYASFLSPAASLANTDAVLEQAAALQNEQLAAQKQVSASGTPASDVTNVPPVSSILAASDAAAQSVLSNYAKAPAGSTILDYQA